MSESYKKKLLIAAGLLIVFVIIIFVSVALSLFNKNAEQNFEITSTSPKNGETNVYPGEIYIHFTTNTPIRSANDYKIQLDPPVNAGTKIISAYPTLSVIHQVLGGLQKNTQYTVTVTNSSNNKSTSWSFTTSEKQPESSSAEVAQEQEELKTNFFPLFEHQPFENENFKIVYTSEFTLQVKIKKNDVEAIKQEVNDWIKSKGVDPSTHTINYENAF